MTLLLFYSCKKEQKKISKSVISVDVKDIYNDTTLSIRAIELLNDKSLAFAANNGAFGLYNPNLNKWTTNIQKKDSINLHFRAVAHTSNDFFMLSIENPALLYKTGDDGKMKLVYKETNEKVFYDAMTFWNDLEGIAIGDPVDDCMSVIITRDGGHSWTKLSCDVLPKIQEGEAAFAASNTNISVFGNNTWIATGGKTSRILFSPNKGKTWEVFETPMINGEATTGIYSLDFYDETHGFAIGGDYTNPKENKATKIVTEDGGKNWRLVADRENPGYRSCVQYVPNSNANRLVVVGFEGIDYSADKGETWKHLSDESFYTIRFLNDSVAYAAGKGRISKLEFK
ncbi:MAG: WD40/YVTN/BNR-like repeat-containing protein [Aquaticitalea sp.]